MKSNVELFFDAVSKNEFKKISKDWLIVLAEIFPKSVINYEDFLILKKYSELMDTVFFEDKSNFSFNYLIDLPIYSFANNDIQKFAAKKIHLALPDVISYLKFAYERNDILGLENIPLEQRIVSRKIINFKKWLDIYFLPGKLVENLNNKNRFSESDFEVIGSLNFSEYQEDLLKIIYSETEKKEKKEIALDALLHLKDEKIDKVLKQMSYDCKIEEQLRFKIIENLITRKVNDKDFWEKSFEYYQDKVIRSKILFKIISLQNEPDLLLSLLKNSNISDSMMILDLIGASNPDKKTIKKLFRYIFDKRYEISKNEKKSFEISEKVSGIFLNYFAENANSINHFNSNFISGLIKVGKIEQPVFFNFINLLIQVLNNEQLENLLNSALNKIEYSDEKKEFLNNIEPFLPFNRLNFDENLVERVSIIKR
jgi:hypothetical protein